MTTDEVKKYLRQAEKLDKRLKRERRNLEKLMSAAEYRSPAFEGVGGGGSGDKRDSRITLVSNGQKLEFMVYSNNCFANVSTYDGDYKVGDSDDQP